MDLYLNGHMELYTLQFSNVYPSDEVNTPGPSSSLSRFTEWHLLLRIKSVEELMYIRSDTKVFSPTPSLTSPAARGMHPDGTPFEAITKPDGIPIVPVSQPSPKVQASLVGCCRGEDATAQIDLELHFDTLEAGVLGLHNWVEPPAGSGGKPREEPLQDVRLRCTGYRSCGWFMGSVWGTAEGKPLELHQSVRFLLKRYTGRRCSFCLDPVYAIGFTCHNCEIPRYCCRECMVAHQRQGHTMVCGHLKENYGPRAGVVANEINQDVRLVAWWTTMREENGSDTRYSILADANSTMDLAIEYFIDTLSDGDLSYRLIRVKDTEKAVEMPDEAILGFSTMLLKEVFYSATHEGFLGLASACLYQLFHHCPSNHVTLEVHNTFFTYFNYDEFEGPVHTVEEYVAHTRPLHSLAQLHIERALRSSISSDFWKYIRSAKEVLVALFSVYMSDPCKDLDEMQTVIDLQRADTLFMLSKVLLIMAARVPHDEVVPTLEKAEKCLLQTLSLDCVQLDDALKAECYFRLSVLLLLYGPSRSEESKLYKENGLALLRTAGGGPIRQQKGIEAAERSDPPVHHHHTADDDDDDDTDDSESDTKPTHRAAGGSSHKNVSAATGNKNKNKKKKKGKK